MKPERCESFFESARPAELSLPTASRFWISYTSQYIEATEPNSTALKVALFIPRLIGGSFVAMVDAVRGMAYQLHLNEGRPYWLDRVELISPALESQEPLSVDQLWLSLERKTEKLSIPYLHESRVRHRFEEIHCAKHTAISLRNGEYLHANRMGDGLSRRTFIASQYPFADQRPDGGRRFWMAVHKEGAAIVDLTTSKDCMPPYYPFPQESRSFNNVQVSSISTDGPISIYEIDSPDVESKQITRFHFDAWPDFGVISVEELHKLVCQIEALNNGPIWVHCRAGVGRSGTLIAAMILKEQIDRREICQETLEERLLDILLQLRSERNRNFVQTQEQFELLFHYAHFLFSL